ncbi:hypothetical protein ABVV53_02140 [Novosphingobium sp. RD2P27]|uniref:Uncharacterized protein n=1 Tax=Novosphingobium kalidii TaxID=3230299 RepID=A0ABV2CXD8_9SPHN
MENEGREVHIERNDARAGSTPHIVRYVLLIGLGLAIVALTVVWVTGAMNANQSGSRYDDSVRAAAEQEQREMQQQQ